MLTYHGVLCHQARDLFSAGSAAGVGGNRRIKETKMEDRLEGKEFDGIYILRALLHLEDYMIDAANTLEDKLFIEYWGEEVCSAFDVHDPKARIRFWLEKADFFAKEWKLSDYLFLD